MKKNQSPRTCMRLAFSKIGRFRSTFAQAFGSLVAQARRLPRRHFVSAGELRSPKAGFQPALAA